MFHNFSMAKEQKTRNTADEDKQSLSGPSIWSTILDVLFGLDNVDKKTKNDLTVISKAISKSHFSKYFSNFTQRATPEFARFFFSVYEKTHTVQLFFNKFELEKSIPQIMNALMSDRQTQILDMLTEDSLFEKSRQMKYPELSTKVKALVAEFHKEFTRERVLAINSLYNAMCVLRSFCSFDYYAYLRLFDTNLRELEFSKKPHFLRVYGPYISEQLADFESRLRALLAIHDWERVFNFVNAMATTPIINVEEWNKLIVRLAAHEEPPVFEYICKVIDKNPSLEIKPSEYNGKIVDKYVKSVDERTVATMQLIYKEQKAAIIRRDLKNMFPNGFNNPLKYYVPDLNELFVQRNLQGYEHCDALSYLQAFLQKYVADEMDVLASELNVYGKSIDKDFIADLLNSCNNLKDYEDQIKVLDGKLNPQLAQGYKLHSFLSQKVIKDDELQKIRVQLDLINAEALKILKGTNALLTEVGARFKKLYEDYTSETRTILSNWKELDGRSSESFKTRLSSIVEAIAKIQKLESNFIA